MLNYGMTTYYVTAWSAVIPLLFTAWVVACPFAALALAAEVKRRVRLFIIERYGQRLAQTFFDEIREWGRGEGIPNEAVDYYIKKFGEEYAWKLGEREANRRLGKPTAEERYH